MLAHRVMIVVSAAVIVSATGGSCERPIPSPQRHWVAQNDARVFEIPARGAAVWSDQDLRITFDHVVRDSRCPAGAECPWAGNALVELSAAPGGRFRLRIGPAGGAADTSRTVVDRAGFRYQAVVLAPLAAVGVEPVDPESYVVTLEVVKLPGDQPGETTSREIARPQASKRAL
ncbi:MAG TPA: hypothetical protein VL123_07145 [Candidatus Udaeobacter sp.]|jgi:hypothetical protein|nr:hypothetical protein [Candidatus Udaeobacter sp.]